MIRGFKIFSSLNYKEKSYGSWICSLAHTNGKLWKSEKHCDRKASKENKKIDIEIE